MAIQTLGGVYIPRSGSLGPTYDGRGEMARFGAIAQAGEVVSNLGQRLADFQVKKRAVVDRGVLASEELQRLKVSAEIEKQLAAMPDTPEKWGKVAEDAWKAHNDATQKRAQAEGWGRELTAAVALENQAFSEKAKIYLGVEQDKAQIRKANASMDALANEYSRFGDYEAAVKTIQGTTRTDEEKVALSQKAVSSGLWWRYKEAFLNAENLPAVDRERQFASFEKELADPAANAVTVDGKQYTLNADTRIELMSLANGAKDRAVNSQLTTLNKIASFMRNYGTDAAAARIAEEVDQKNITRAMAMTVLPEFEMIRAQEAERAARGEALTLQKAQELQQKAADEQAKQARTFESLSARIESGEAYEADTVSALVESGDLTLQQGVILNARAKLKSEVRTIANEKASRALRDFSTISPAKLSDKISEYAQEDADAKGKLAPFREAMLYTIAGRKDLTDADRRDLVQQFINASLTHFGPFDEEQTKNGAMHFNGREIDGLEVSYRNDIYSAYKAVSSGEYSSALSKPFFGRVLLANEQAAEAFFTSSDYLSADPKQRVQMKAQFQAKQIEELQKAVAGEVIDKHLFR